jgi:hypothetical protein
MEEQHACCCHSLYAHRSQLSLSGRSTRRLNKLLISAHLHPVNNAPTNSTADAPLRHQIFQTLLSRAAAAAVEGAGEAGCCSKVTIPEGLFEPGMMPRGMLTTTPTTIGATAVAVHIEGKSMTVCAGGGAGGSDVWVDHGQMYKIILPDTPPDHLHRAQAAPVDDRGADKLAALFPLQSHHSFFGLDSF